jgi:hypothetical protein
MRGMFERAKPLLNPDPVRGALFRFVNSYGTFFPRVDFGFQ